jgi:hypothetical protein
MVTILCYAYKRGKQQMEISLTPAITSFVIRFIHNESPNPGDAKPAAGQLVRGTIRNVQTNEEVDFTRWEGAVEFIERFVSLVEDVSFSNEAGSEGNGG